jgi:ferric-dicitrate binding protein FerR (iron transport regulator)
VAKTKSKSEQAKIAATRLMQDEEVQKQMRIATKRLREAWSRASGRPASKAMSDKQVYAKVRAAAASLAIVGRKLRPKPEPPKRRGRKVVAGAAVAGGAAYAVMKMRGNNGNGGQYTPVPVNAPSGPVAAPTPPTPVESG